MKGNSNLKGALALLLVLAAAGALYLAGLGDLPLSDPGEGRYAAVAAAMGAGHDWVVPTLGGRPYLAEPILGYWALAGGQALMGDGELGARLPSALSLFLLVLAVGLLVWRSGGRASLGALAAAALAFCPLVVLVGRSCLPEALFSLWTTLSLLAVFLALEGEDPAGRGWWLAAWAALGLGFLSKGPLVLVLVLPSAALYALAQGCLGWALRHARWLGGLVIFLLINLPWYGLAWWQLGDRFGAVFLSQTLGRFPASLWGQGQGLFYYLPVLLLGAFPFAAAALPELGRALFQNPRAQRELDSLSRLHLLAAVSLLVMLVVLSLAADKQVSLILPVLPFVAVLAACQLRRLALGQGRGRLAWPLFWAFLWLSGGILVLALAGFPAVLPWFWERIVALPFWQADGYALPLRAPLLVLWPLLAALAAGAGVYLASWAVRRGRQGLLPWVLGGGAALLCVVLFLGLAPQVAGVLQQPAKELALQVQRRAGQEAKVVTYGLAKPSLVYYTGRDLSAYRVGQGQELGRELAAAAPVYVYSRVRLEDQLAALPGFKTITSREGYLLGGNAAALAQWQGLAPPPVSPAPPAPVTPPDPTAPAAPAQPDAKAAPGPVQPQSSDPTAPPLPSAEAQESL